MILSLLCLAKLKSTEDLLLIESLLENDTILWPERGQGVKVHCGRATHWHELQSPDP